MDGKEYGKQNYSEILLINKAKQKLIVLILNFDKHENLLL